MTTLVAAQRGLRNRWRLVSAIATTFVVIAAIYALWVYSAAMNVERLLDEAEALDIPAIAAGDEAALASARLLVDESESATESLSGRLGPARVAATSLGWLPWLGDQVRAPSLLTARAEADLRAARRMVSAADDLFALQTLISGGGLTFGSASEELDTVIDSLRGSAALSAVEMGDVRSAASNMDGLSLLGIYESRVNRITSLEGTLLAYGDLLQTAPDAIAAARDVGSSASELLDELRAGSDGADLEGLSRAVTELADTSKTAADHTALLEALVQETMPGSSLAVLVSDLSMALGAVADLGSGLSVINENFSGAIEVLKESDGPLLSNGDELQRALQLLVSERGALGEASERAAAAVQTLADLISSGRVDFLPANLRDVLIDQTALLLDAGAIMSDGPELLLDLIAPDSSKTYLVLGQTSDELRAAGGFTSSAWTLTFTDGSLTNTRFIPILQFDDGNGTGAPVPPAPEPLRYYMDAGGLYLRDVGWDPDFANVGRLAVELYRVNQGDDIDGVIAITQWGIIRLVEALGGLEVDGQFITPSGAIAFIEQRTDIEGTGFLQLLFTGLLDSVRGDSAAIMQIELVRAFREILERKDMMIFSLDSGEQLKVEALGWGGRFPVTGRDRLAIIDSNVGWSKSDRSIERSVAYQVDLSSGARPAAVLTISYRNNGTEVGRKCDLQSPPLPAHLSYDVAKNSCYWNYVRAFVSVGSELISADDLPLLRNSVPDRLNRQEPGTPTFSHEFDEKGDHFAGLVVVAPGSESDFSIKYLLPESVARHTESRMVYELDLVAQSGAQGRQVVIEIRLPAGHFLESSSHKPVSVVDGVARFEIFLLSDQIFRIETTAS